VKYSAHDREYQSRPEQVKKRVTRNAARRLAIKKHGKKAMKGKDVHHVKGTKAGNSRSNLKVISRTKNRSMK